MSGPVLIAGFAYADGKPLEGRWLERYDPDYLGGLGRAWWTNDPEKAQQFESPAVAFEFWRQPSKVKPFRPDGKPNRPLCAVSIEFSSLEKAREELNAAAKSWPRQ